MSTHVLFIFLQIHKHMQFIKQSFRKQKNERVLGQLEHTKQDLMNQLYVQQNRSDIKQFAQKQGMQSVRLNRVKRITS